MFLEKGSLLRERYQIEGQLGKGGMGAVYLAFDQTLGIRVALKENLNPSPESERQFRREATLLATLRHPNLPRVTDHFILPERQYLVMDYVEGVDLHTLAIRKSHSLEQVLAWADEVADALVYLHSRKPPIIHRDVKPANLKIQPNGTVMLVDFGIAKVFEGEYQTETGARGMTPGFSPPEQYGSGRTDPSSDQFSLAATIYTLLTGDPPADSIERMLGNQEYAPPRTLNPDIPEHVDAALNRALSISQGDRFPNMASFRAALKGEGAPATIRSDARQPVGRRSLLLALLAGSGFLGTLVVAALLLITLFNGLPATGPEPSQTPTETVSIKPSATPMASPTHEPSPTPEPTPPPTVSPVPTEVPLLLGGGGRIAFVSDRENGQTLQIWTMKPDGTGMRQLTFGPRDKSQPKWSPDGRRLLFVAPGGQDSFGNDLGQDLWSINADGTDLRNATHATGNDTDPVWSPDGSRIAFTSDRINGQHQVFVMDSACLNEAAEDACWNLKPNRISCTSDFCAVEFSPSWSPDGSTIAVAASINSAPGRIYLRSPEGGDPTQFDRSDTIIGATDLHWSPKGDLLAFTWHIARGRNEIYLVSIQNPQGEPIQLTNSLGNKEPSFSYDGQWIAFTSTRNQDLEIYLMAANGSNETNLTNNPASRDMQPDWQPPLR